MLFFLVSFLAIQDPSPSWKTICEDAAFARVKHVTTRSDRSAKFVISKIISGVEEHSNENNLTDEESLELCFITLAVANQESNYEFLIGAAGEIGMYQIKLNTLRLERSKISFINDYSDTSLVVSLLDHKIATRVFLVHFVSLYNKTGDIKKALERYNGAGLAAEQYAEQVFEKYLEIRSLQ